MPSSQPTNANGKSRANETDEPVYTIRDPGRYPPVRPSILLRGYTTVDATSGPSTRPTLPHASTTPVLAVSDSHIPSSQALLEQLNASYSTFPGRHGSRPWSPQEPAEGDVSAQSSAAQTTSMSTQARAPQRPGFWRRTTDNLIDFVCYSPTMPIPQGQPRRWDGATHANAVLRYWDRAKEQAQAVGDDPTHARTVKNMVAYICKKMITVYPELADINSDWVERVLYQNKRKPVYTQHWLEDVGYAAECGRGGWGGFG